MCEFLSCLREVELYIYIFFLLWFLKSPFYITEPQNTCQARSEDQTLGWIWIDNSHKYIECWTGPDHLRWSSNYLMNTWCANHWTCRVSLPVWVITLLFIHLIIFIIYIFLFLRAGIWCSFSSKPLLNSDKIPMLNIPLHKSEYMKGLRCKQRESGRVWCEMLCSRETQPESELFTMMVMEPHICLFHWKLRN